MWGEWWVWAAAALALGILELLAPAYVFLGFAAGGVVMALALLVGGPAAGWIAGSLPLALLVFALVSGAAWVGLRTALGAPGGTSRIVHRDVNDD